MKKQLAVLPIGHGGARLQALMADIGRYERFVEDERGIFEARIDIAIGPLVGGVAHRQTTLAVVCKVLLGPLDFVELRYGGIRRLGAHPHVPILARIRSAGPQALKRVDDEGKRFKVDLDLLDCFGAGKFVDRRNGQNRIAHIDGLVCQRALAPLAGLDDRAVVVQAVGGRGNIVGSENRLDPGHRQGIIHIDMLDAGMRHGAEHQPAKQHAFSAKVLGIF